MYCWKCGRENPETAIFCSHCGTNLSNPVQKVEQDSVQKVSIQAKDKYVPTPLSNSDLIGIGGWLLLFCIGLTIISPIRNAIAFSLSLNNNPSLFVLIWNAILMLGIGLFYSMVIGIRIWKCRSNAIKQARFFLIVSVVVDIICFVILIITNYAVIIIAPEKLVISISSVGSCITWLFYLAKSKRIKNTFPNIAHQGRE